MSINPILATIVGVLLVGFLLLGVKSCTVIDPGHIGVQTTFGSLNETPIQPGLSFVNPLSSVTEFDCRQKTYGENDVHVPSQDQLATNLDISIQYRVVAAMAPKIYRETGSDPEAVVNVHLKPKLHSELREIGKTVKRAEDYYTEEVQQRMQREILASMQGYMNDKGFEIQVVFIKDIKLPDVIVKAVTAKKEREQVAVRQQAELDRFTVEQQQKIATAEAEKKAAQFESDKVKIAADAEAYKIEAINKAIGSSPSYVQLQALEALKAISSSPSSKVYFINGDSPKPLPLMHLGDDLKQQPEVREVIRAIKVEK